MAAENARAMPNAPAPAHKHHKPLTANDLQFRGNHAPGVLPVAKMPRMWREATVATGSAPNAPIMQMAINLPAPRPEVTRPSDCRALSNETSNMKWRAANSRRVILD
jgi:hypothetical protein